uniref:Syntaxin-8 n=1 Tax=Cacopsylla melanoneura TaxID=428564 RepID=A0A8D8U5U9_9HEMI
MSLVLIDNNDPWLAEYNTCENLYQKIVETLQLRNNQPKNSDEYSRISATIRVQLKQYSNEVNQLKVQLQTVAASNTLTRDEIERRQRLLEQLQSSNVKITTMYNNRPSYAAQRSELLADAGTTGWGDDDASDEESPLLSGDVSDIREQQQMMIQAQDQGLEALSKVISRQKNIALTISNEVDTQNELVDDIADRMDHTNVSIQQETRQVTSILVQDATCGYWVVIIVLFIANVIVLTL